MKDKPIEKDFECPDCKCFLESIYPNTDASLACDLKCYFSKGEVGEKYLESYINKYPLQYKQLKDGKG